jgi:hypothetical protein
MNLFHYFRKSGDLILLFVGELSYDSLLASSELTLFLTFY